MKCCSAAVMLLIIARGSRSEALAIEPRTPCHCSAPFNSALLAFLLWTNATNTCYFNVCLVAVCSKKLWQHVIAQRLVFCKSRR